MQRKGCGAPGDRRNVPYEKLKETGDGARARLPCLPSSSTSQQCACSGRKLAVLPVKVSGFLWACIQAIVYAQLPVCVRPWVGLRASELGSRRMCCVQISFHNRSSEQNQIWLKSQGKAGDGTSQDYLSNFSVMIHNLPPILTVISYAHRTWCLPNTQQLELTWIIDFCIKGYCPSI